MAAAAAAGVGLKEVEDAELEGWPTCIIFEDVRVTEWNGSEEGEKERGKEREEE